MSVRFADVRDDVLHALDAGLSELAAGGALVGHWSKLADGPVDAVGPFGVYSASAEELALGGLNAAHLIGYRWVLLRDDEPLASAELQRMPGGAFGLVAVQDGPALTAAFEAFTGAEATVGEGDYEARFLVARDLGLSLVWFAGADHRLAGATDGAIDEEMLIERALRAPAPRKSGRQVPRVLRGIPLTAAAAQDVNEDQPQTVVLNFLIQSQQMANWCWAAVTSSIYVFFTGDNSTWPQCVLANSTFGQTACCETPWIAACDQGSNTGTALTLVGCLYLNVANAATQGETEGYINAGHPVGVAIVSGGMGHALTIYGYTQTGGPNDVIYLGDPWPTMGYSAINFNQFPASYGAGGFWTNTFITKSP